MNKQFWVRDESGIAWFKSFYIKESLYHYFNSKGEYWHVQMIDTCKPWDIDGIWKMSDGVYRIDRKGVSSVIVFVPEDGDATSRLHAAHNLGKGAEVSVFIPATLETTYKCSIGEFPILSLLYISEVEYDRMERRRNRK